MRSDSQRSNAQRGLACVWALTAALAVAATHDGGAQEKPAGSADPRVGLKAGLHDAGVAARNMELVASLPKPKGFFDPKSPAGEPTPPETEGNGGPGRGTRQQEVPVPTLAPRQRLHRRPARLLMPPVAAVVAAALG